MFLAARQDVQYVMERQVETEKLLNNAQEWQTSKLAETIENLYDEKNVIDVIKLIIFAKKMEKNC